MTVSLVTFVVVAAAAAELGAASEAAAEAGPETEAEIKQLRLKAAGAPVPKLVLRLGCCCDINWMSRKHRQLNKRLEHWHMAKLGRHLLQTFESIRCQCTSELNDFGVFREWASLKDVVFLHGPAIITNDDDDDDFFLLKQVNNN